MGFEGEDNRMTGQHDANGSAEEALEAKATSALLSLLAIYLATDEGMRRAIFHSGLDHEEAVRVRLEACGVVCGRCSLTRLAEIITSLAGYAQVAKMRQQGDRTSYGAMGVAAPTPNPNQRPKKRP